MMNNVWAFNYTLSIHPTWLAANNYIIGNIIPSPTVTVSSGVTTTLITLNCASQTTMLCATGQVYCDANDNGVLDSGETPIANAPISVNGTLAYSNTNGIYTISYPGTSNNSYNLSMSSNWLALNGYSILNNNGSNLNSITGTPCNSGTPISTVNFPLNCGGPIASTMCYSGYVFCDANNNGIMNAGETPLISAPVLLYNNTTSASSVTVYTDSTGYFSYCGQMSTGNNLIATISQYWLTYNGYNPTIGVITLVGSTSGSANNGSLLQILGNAYDPNDKNASTDYMNDNYPLGYLDAFIDDALTYTIRFQNTGTAPAQNVYIIDTLSTLLDWPSFTLIEASHPMQVVNLGNGVMRFEFNQIWLPDSISNEPESHGQLTYRISEKPTNAIMSIIENTAYIYFDWNDAIVTNTTFHQNMWLDNVAELADALRIYPNPAQTEIQLDLMVQSVVQIEDLNGKIVYNQVVLPGQKINIEYLNPGIYFVETDQQRTKLIKN
jgi:uncharacterized repeat protein (TIGR01451 family)